MSESSDFSHSVPGETLEEIGAQFGTPFYLYDIDTFRSNVGRVRTSFGNEVSVYFAVKANPNLELLKAIQPVVDGLDVSSVGEFEQALLAGYDPRHMSFAGPAKTTEELRPAIERGIGSISVESLRELDEIASIAAELGKTASITIRVNPLKNSKAFGLKMGGRATQFGIDEEDLPSIARTVAEQHDSVDFAGIHVYAGSQGFDHQLLADNIQDTIRICQQLEQTTGFHCRKINFGGGFGVSHGSTTKDVDLCAIYNGIKDDFLQLQKTGESSRELIFELGRFLIADAGIYVARVISTKESRGKRFVIVDGGLHHHLAAAGMFGVGIRTNYEVRNLSRPEAQSISCNVAGPSCNPTDLLGVNVELPTPEPGDLIAVMSSGSYAFTASPLLFLGRPTPAEVIRDGANLWLGRRPYSITDFN